MKNDIEWLKNEILELSIKARYKENSQREWHMGHEMALFDVNKLIDQLDEPETLSEEWIENHTASADTISYYSDENVPVVTVSNLKGLLVPIQDKPVIPQFIADWIERQKQPDWYYENKENALADSIHFTLYSLGANYPETNPDVILRKPVNEWLENDRNNYWKLIDGVRYGYEVEKEPVYFAKIKGHELVETETILDEDTGENISDYYRNVYFVLQRNGELVIDMKDNGLSGAKNVMTMNQWNDLGINESNADFEEVME